MPEISASNPTEIVGVTTRYPRWRVAQGSFTVGSIGTEIDAYSVMRKGNDTGYSPLPDDGVTIRVPDVVANALSHNDTRQLQLISIIEDAWTEFMLIEMERRNIR